MRLVLLFFNPSRYDPTLGHKGGVFLFQYFDFLFGFFLTVKHPGSRSPFVGTVRFYFNHVDCLAVWTDAKSISQICVQNRFVEFTGSFELKHVIKEDLPGLQKRMRRIGRVSHEHDFTRIGHYVKDYFVSLNMDLFRDFLDEFRSIHWTSIVQSGEDLIHEEY